MLGRLSRLSGLTLLLGLLAVPAAHASSRFSIHVGVGPAVGPVAIAAPYPGYVWQRGHYVRFGYRIPWFPGRGGAPNAGGGGCGWDGVRFGGNWGAVRGWGPGPASGRP